MIAIPETSAANARAAVDFAVPRKVLSQSMVQGANLIANVPHNLVDTGRTIGVTIKHALDNGYAVIEVTEEAEQKWVDLLLSGPGMTLGSLDCTPGYYNNEGQPGGLGREWFLGYPGGAQAYFQYLDHWRNTGDFEGLEFR